MTLDRHLDGPMTDIEFEALEEELAHMSNENVINLLDFLETMSLEGQMFGDECYGCTHQADNAARAAKMARHELRRRK